jgi:hypothetical protein
MPSERIRAIDELQVPKEIPTNISREQIIEKTKDFVENFQKKF